MFRRIRTSKSAGSPPRTRRTTSASGSPLSAAPIAGAQAQATRRWYANADEIAAFLASANPNWNRQVLQDALHAHLEMTTAAVVAKLHEDTAAAVAAYDKGHEHMLMVADVLSSGIVKQFPERFDR